jgi:hypothetical protein
MNTRGSSGQKRNGAGEVAADELCFSPPRRIERGLFDSPSMNTRSCLSAQKQKEGPVSRPVGPDEEEVANDDDDYTSDRIEEATIKFSFPDRKSVKKLNIIFDNCSGQNKKYTVLKLAMWLKEML